jgi:predicted small secreted protein
MKDRVMAWMSLNGPTVGLVALVITAVVLITGCNTVAGVGTDITKSAQWTKDKMSGNKDSQPQGGTK